MSYTHPPDRCGIMKSMTAVKESQPNLERQENDEICEFPTTMSNERHTNVLLRTSMVILLSTTIVLVVVDATTTRYAEQFYASLVDWLSSNLIIGVFVVIIVYILATILFIPGSILTIGTGYAFHQALQQQQYSKSIILAVLLSSVAVFVGATLGSILCFLLGRYIFRDVVVQMANRYEIFRAVDRGMSKIATIFFHTLRTPLSHRANFI